MARTKMNQRSASRVDVPMGATGGRTPPSRLTVLLLLTCALSVIWALAMLTPFGRAGYYYFYAYSEFYMGVISLVALSVTIMIGLVATDRLVLTIRQRVLLQSAHRTTGLIAVAALGLHLWTKLMESHIRLIDIVIPFLAPYNRLFVGLGTVSGWIMVLVMWTGLARTRFIGRGKPWMWRSVHAVSYLMWPIALVHGLSAGRPAKTWVIVSYIVCVLGVLVGLAVRLSVSLNRRKDFASTSTGTIKPVGAPATAAAPGSSKRRSRWGGDDAREPGPAPVQPWVPATPPPVSPAPAPAYDARPAYDDRPASPAPRTRRYEEEPVAARSGRTIYADTAPRSRRAAAYDDDRGAYDDEPVAPRPRRGESRRAVPADAGREIERYDEPTRPMSRRAADDRHGWDDEDEPAPRRRREPAGEEVAPRGRRRADDDYARRVLEQSRATRYADDDEDDEPAPRGRRSAEGVPAPRGRRAAAEDGGRRAAAEDRGRRYADDWDDDDAEPRARRRADEARSLGAQSGEFRTGELRLDRTGEFSLDDDRAPRGRRYADEEPARPRRAVTDSGRHSRSEFVDLAEPADPWGGADDPNYLPPDETPTLVDMASRRARRAEQADAGRGPAGRGARRGRSRAGEEMPDDQYWRQLRGEAQ
jgi:hypothetical protein